MGQTSVCPIFISTLLTKATITDIIQSSLGPVAQLGAHHIRIVGVVGSNPIRSTIQLRLLPTRQKAQLQ